MELTKFNKYIILFLIIWGEADIINRLAIGLFGNNWISIVCGFVALFPASLFIAKEFKIYKNAKEE